MATILASILSADYARLGQQVREADEAGVDGVTVDIMDGSFVPTITFGPGIVRAIRPLVSRLLDVDLMIVNPEKHLAAFVDAGADRLIVHRESCTHPYRVLREVSELGVQAGIALAPGTPLSSIEELLDIVDVVQIMTVCPGKGGQALVRSQLDKISRLRDMLSSRGLSTGIVTDGGAKVDTAALLVRAGASAIVAGSAIFGGQQSIAKNVKALRLAMDRAALAE
jgi:ribulose-phosphate 3-epimerase